MTERRTIDELITRYELEPDLKDVFVEGPRDQSLIEWIAHEAGLRGIAAYEVASVDVPLAVCLAHDAGSGNRGRVIALAKQFASQAEVDLYHRVACIVDGDLDHFLDALPNGRLLIITDFTSPELYCFDERAIRKFLQLVVGRSGIDAGSVLHAIEPLLRELFMIRVALAKLRVPLGLLPFDSACRVRNGLFVFDRVSYLERVVRREGFGAKLPDVLAEVERLHAIHVDERRHVIHGHDFVAVLRWFLRDVLRIRAVPDLQHCERALRACLEFSYVSQSQLVGELRTRFS